MKIITIFGETKKCIEWSKDTRCVVKYHTFVKRLSNGWSPERALTEECNTGENYLVNKKFGRLTVVQFSGRVTPRGQKYWFCKCDCGKDVCVLTARLVGGITKSCGCYRKETSLEKIYKFFYLGYGIAARNRVLGSYKSEAKNRKIEWKLSDEDVFSLTKQKCHYCDCEPSKIMKSGKGEIYLYNGIDRVNSDLGYTTNNVVPCCEQCNVMKWDYNQENFLIKVKEIYEFNRLHEKVLKQPLVRDIIVQKVRK